MSLPSLTPPQIVQGLVEVGKRLGVEYRLSAPISSISLSPDGRTVTGVKLTTGEELTADIVVCNADLVYAYNKLLPQTSTAKSLSKRPASCSSISFYWALDKQIPELTAHNIFLADEFRTSFDSIFKQHLIPSKPSFYVNVPSRIDPTAAPAGKDALVVLVPVGHLLTSDSDEHKGMSDTSSADVSSKQDWDTMVSFAKNTVLQTMQARIGVDLAPRIRSESVNTPHVWRERFNLDRGAILGLSHSFFNVLSFRPKTKHPSIDGLFFVGASTHPGTGVPICLAGGKLVAEQILQEVGMRVPWEIGKEKRGKWLESKGEQRSELDRLQEPPIGWRALIGLLLILLLSLWTFGAVTMGTP